MDVSRIVMAMWDKQIAQLGAESGWIMHFLKLYVDDVTAIVETLKMGVRWTMPSPKVANVSDVLFSDECESPQNGAAAATNASPPSTGGLVYKKAWEIEDKKSSLTYNQRTTPFYHSFRLQVSAKTN